MPVDILAYTYAATVAAGGVLGFIKSNSIPSLGAGLFFGTILGYGAYQTSVDPTNVGVFLGASTTLGGVMGYRLYHSGKIMPAGVARHRDHKGLKGLVRARRLGENSDGADVPPTPGAGNFGEVGGPTGSKANAVSWHTMAKRRRQGKSGVGLARPQGPKMTMERTTIGTHVNGAGGVGSSSTGAKGGGRPDPPASLSNDRENNVVVHQANLFSNATGEEASGYGRRRRRRRVRERRRRRRRLRCVSVDGLGCVGLVRRCGPGAAATGRKRGRPPTTGDNVGLAEAKKRLLELTLQERQLQLDAAVEDATVHPRPVHKSCKPLPSETELAAVMRLAATSDLGAVILEKMAVVQKVAETSRNLKGTYVRCLREATLHIKHASAEQAKRTTGSEREVELDRELRELRARLAATEAVSRVRVDETAADATGASPLNAVVMPPPPPPWAAPLRGPSRTRRSAAFARAPAGDAAAESAPPPAPSSP
ncbi:Transmembrane protein 14C [Dufourea novaeangliae]|uniref:Transmembrane protein 14C n=1 Tax=Dufourea novaeangliae TaxID=178035 RepID=A0A154PAU8_DUFNO|nr:Transmembrane protein 14C [Dufourea novaeangliae]